MSQDLIESTFNDKVYFKSIIRSQVWLKNYSIEDGVYDLDFEGRHCTIEIISESDTDKFLIVTAYYEIPITSRKKAAFEELEGHLYLKNERGSGVNGGKIKGFVDEYGILICSLPERLLHRIQWRFDFLFSGEIKLESFWSLDSENWKRAVTSTLRFRIQGAVGYQVPISGENVGNESATLASDKPLHRNLIQNADALVEKDPRSAIMLAATALEVGLKNLLFNKYPILEGFYKDTQLPAIPKLLSYTLLDKSHPPVISQPSIISTYIPGFHIELATVKKLENFFRERNQCVHQGKLDINWEKLYDYIEIIEDVLYYIDYHNGYTWASKYIRKPDQFKFNSSPES